MTPVAIGALEVASGKLVVWQSRVQGFEKDSKM